VSVVGNSYLIPLVKGRTDLLRIPQKLVNDLGIKDAITTTAMKPDGRKLPVRLNPIDRTIIGLESWLKTPTDEEVRSVRLEILSEHPYSFAVEFSEQAPDLGTATEDMKIHRSDQGLYLGGELSSEFYELFRTNKPVAIDESDLLQHVFICGSTGSGKTVLAKVLIEEAALKSIPVIAIDLKGDISSMGILSSGEDPTEIIPWVSPQRNESREVKAATVAEQHKARLERWGLGYKDVDNFKKKVAVNVFTPRSNAGFRLALSAFVEPPEDVEELKEKDPDSFEDIIHFMAETFVSRLTLTRKRADKAKGYIYEIIRTFWDQGISLRGYDGIKKVLDEVMLNQAGIEKIGGMQIDEYISARDREDISIAINSLLIGAQKLWFQGFPVDIETLVNSNNYDGRTPITIINIKHLNFQDQAYVVGYVAYLIWFWMRRFSGTDRPKLIFYIDEIGGGGGLEAFYPSVAKTPCKPALRKLLHEGRGFGVCCIFATQSPGQIDYIALGQCHTWAVGQLTMKRERQKIEQGAGIAELDFEIASQHLSTLSTGQFLVRTPSLSWTILDGRWVMHPIHRGLSQKDIERLKENYEKDVSDLFEEAQRCANSKNLSTAKNILESIINGYRFSALCAKTYLLLGTVLYDMSDYESAIKKLEDMVKYRMEAEEIGEAYFIIGKCKEQQERFVDATVNFRKVGQSAANEEIKTNALSHEQYCNNRASWSELTQVQKFFWWIIGKKPDDAVLIRLQIKDKGLLEKQFKTVLNEQDFSIPDPIDFQELIQAGKKATDEEREKSVEQIKAERWARDQVPKIEAFLEQGALNEAFLACKRIIQRLNDAGGRAADSLVSAFGKCNKCSEEKSQVLLNKKLLIIDARQFEFEIANLFRHKGYNSFATRVTNDDGVDVFASNNEEKVIVQCKRWRRPVGRDKVDELAGVKSRYGVDRAILATTSTFSEDAKRAAHENHIELWDFYRIKHEWQAVFSENHV